MKTSNLRRVHNADMQLGTEAYLQLCTIIGGIFENDAEDKFYNRIQFQSSNNGGFWSINISAFSLPLFFEFLSAVHQEMPVEEVQEIVDEPEEIIPLDESLEGVNTVVPEMDTDEETEEDDEEPEDDSEDVAGLVEGAPVRLKKRLLKPASVQKVASGVTVEDFDDDAE